MVQLYKIHAGAKLLLNDDTIISVIDRRGEYIIAHDGSLTHYTRIVRKINGNEMDN